MKNANRQKEEDWTLSYRRRTASSILLWAISLLCTLPMLAQDATTVKGLVLDATNEPIIGATVIVKDNPSIGTITDLTGEFVLKVPSKDAILIVSYIGMQPKEIAITAGKYMRVALQDDNVQLQEVVVVGYGQQKKESVVGAITQAKGEVLQRTGGVSSVGAALTGNLPGVTTVSGSGAPGGDDPQIYIRGQGTWNNASPLILVDGIERSMSGLDVNSIKSVSVLKDASATAVFGVKGANGVILITTKRGNEGKAAIQVAANTTIKFPSKLPSKYDSYDALSYRNEAILREVPLNEASWSDYTPYDELQNYRNYSSVAQRERYPNVDWQNELFKDYTVSTNANINVSGGTSFVKYFASMDYTHEGDLMNVQNNGKGYDPGYGYDRFNVRSNLDFNLTKSTKLSLNLAGYYSDKQDTWTDFEYRMWQAAYTMAPDVFLPQYSDGAWGHYPNDPISNFNSLQAVSNTGIRSQKTTKINTDFILEQDLGMLLKGLTAKATFSMDNTFLSQGGIIDRDDNAIQKWIAPDGTEYLVTAVGDNNYDYVVDQWTVQADNVNDGATWRKTFYQFQLNYARKFGNHNMSAMGLFSRDEYATGSEFPYYREDWVFRATYDYLSRYFVEMNGSYNGSEKFGKDYRFEFFPSAALGWMISEEPFMKFSKGALDMMKLRASYGVVGDDSGSGRWLYQSQWSYGGNTLIGGQAYESSPYNWYKESLIGNADIHWEKVTKQNYGVDFSFWNGLLAGSLDVFKDHREDILLAGSSRSVPDFFGGDPATVNLGKVDVKGYELALRSNYVFDNGLRLWGNFNFTHAEDEILDADNPQLLSAYQKTEGFSIGQPKMQIEDDFYNTWDEVYGSTALKTYDNEKLPGNYNMVDFNGDGVINDYDNAPVGYSERPQNNYNWTIGAEWKGWSAFVQFYAVNNASRYMVFENFRNNMNVVYDQGAFWSPDQVNVPHAMPRWQTHVPSTGDHYLYDSSYVRLKTCELAYTWDKGWIKHVGLKSFKLYVNGNNLLFWSDLPDDRESEVGGDGVYGAYPTMKRVNLGLKITL